MLKSKIKKRELNSRKTKLMISVVLGAVLIINNGAIQTVKADDSLSTSSSQTQTYVDSTIASTWGTSPVSFDEKTGILTVSEGNLVNISNSKYIDTENKISKNNVKEIVFVDGVKLPADSSSFFSNNDGTFNNLTKISGNLNTSGVTNMASMFMNSNIMSLDLSNWDTSNVTSMFYMFNGASNLTSLDISNFDTSKLTSGEINLGMFQGTYKLSSIVLGQKFSFPGLSWLPEISTDDGTYTGRWVRTEPSDPKVTYASSQDFMSSYSGNNAGTYVWEKAVYAGKNITVKYQDENGFLLQSDLLQGNIGDTYSTDAKTFNGYTLKITPENASGKFSDQAQTVTYIYTKNQEVNNQTYDVFFESNGGSIIAKQTIKSKSKLTPPKEPTRTGYVFKGWYTNKELTNSYNFNLPVSQSFTLYAKWTESKQTVTVPTGSSTNHSTQEDSLPSTGENGSSILSSVGLIFITSVVGIFFLRKNIN